MMKNDWKPCAAGIDMQMGFSRNGAAIESNNKIEEEEEKKNGWKGGTSKNFFFSSERCVGRSKASDATLDPSSPLSDEEGGMRRFLSPSIPELLLSNVEIRNPPLLHIRLFALRRAARKASRSL